MIRTSTMRRIRILFLTAVLCCACNNTKTEEAANDTAAVKDTVSITAEDIQSIDYTEFVMDDKAVALTQNWLRMAELSDHMQQLKQGELSFFEDKAILGSFLNDLSNEVPETINTPEVQARLSVFKTAALKLESLNNLANVERPTKLEYIREVLEAYNHTIYQINKTVERQSQRIERPR